MVPEKSLAMKTNGIKHIAFRATISYDHFSFCHCENTMLLCGNAFGVFGFRLFFTFFSMYFYLFFSLSQPVEVFFFCSCNPHFFGPICFVSHCSSVKVSHILFHGFNSEYNIKIIKCAYVYVCTKSFFFFLLLFSIFNR